MNLLSQFFLFKKNIRLLINNNMTAINKININKNSIISGKMFISKYLLKKINIQIVKKRIVQSNFILLMDTFIIYVIYLNLVSTRNSLIIEC